MGACRDPSCKHIRSLRDNQTGNLMPREWEELERNKDLFDGVATYYPSHNVTSSGPPEAVPAQMIPGNPFQVPNRQPRGRAQLRILATSNGK